MKTILTQFALENFNPSSEKVKGQSTNNLTEILYTVISVLTWAVGFIAVIMLIYGGIRYITAQGNDKNVATARSIIMYAVIGLIITGIAAAIQTFVLAQIGIGTD